ncbi:1927_t:CDS:2, partial [Gigaspora rosea]
MSSFSKIQIDLSQELEALSFELKDEKLNEYLNKLGALSHVKKEAKFRFQINEYHQMEIVERVASFAKQHKLEHILFESMTLLNSNDFGSGIDAELYQRAKNAIILFDSPSMPFFNPLKKVEYLWGNMPAIDIVKIDSNKFSDGKSSFNKPINLLFAASGDLNDTIIPMNGLLLDFNQPANICINDYAERIVARNFIILYLLAKLGKNAIDMAIQIWYSSALTDKQSIKCLEIFSKIVQDSQMAKEYSFEFGKLKIHTHFNPKTWKCLVEMLANRTDIQTGIVMRNDIMLNPTRIDYRYRYLQRLTLEQICFDNFRHHGILLPCGALNAHHNTQNRFIVRHGTANEDFYGKLFFYLHEQFEMFVDRLQKLTINFDLYDENALKLNEKLKDKRFDRIYVNNLGDESYV